MKLLSRKNLTVLVFAVALLLLRGSNPVAPDTHRVSVDGQFVLFLDESGDRTAETADLIGSADVRKVLATTDGWRHWDVDVSTDRATPVFVELLELGKSSSPCVVLAKDGRASVVPLPTDLPAMLELLNQWEAR